jgi:hypothetical protein
MHGVLKIRGALKYAALALMAGLAAGQQPTPTPAPQRPIQTIRPSPGTPMPSTPTRPQIQPTRRVPPQQSTTPVPQPTPFVMPPQPKPAPQQQQAQQQAPAVAAPQAAPAPTPVSLEPIKPSAMPPVPPQVTYRDNMLTVQAVNSTLGSLLNAIRNKTGIQFEGAENAGERVAVSIGPAPEGEVLASIFNGSGFDYVAIAREDNPEIVQRVIMTPKGRGAGVAAAFAPAAQQVQQAQQAQETDEDVPDEQVEAEQDTPATPPPVAPPAQAQQQPQQQQQQDQQQQPGAPPTPEELLQKMKQMQQQQQGGQQPPPNQAPKKQMPQ